MGALFFTSLAFLGLSWCASKFGAGGKLVALGFGAAALFGLIAAGLVYIATGISNVN